MKNTEEERLVAYLELIRVILNCPPGQEAALLEPYPSLLDEGLIQMMRLVALQLDEEGNPDGEWLRQFAGQLAQWLGVERVDDSIQEAAEFVCSVMQQIVDTGGDRIQIYNYWQENVARFNQDFLNALPKVFQSVQNNETPEFINLNAIAFYAFGFFIREFSMGSRRLNVEMAIISYKNVLRVHTQDAFPEQWAGAKVDLANSYLERIGGDRADNIESAIMHYEGALQVRNRNTFPEKWADIHNNLASAYGERIKGDQSNNMEMAIASCQRALQVRTRDTLPLDWATTQNNLALSYRGRILGDRAENLELSITAIENTLQVYSRNEFPQEWARSQSNLAVVYSNRIRGERANNIEMAIASHEKSFQVYSREAFPELWARAQNNLATCYIRRILGRQADNIELAITAFEKALQVLTQDDFPFQWANVNDNLSMAYIRRIQGDRAKNIEMAITASQKAMRVFTQDAFPRQWANATNGLAVAYSDRDQGEREINIEKAISLHKEALSVYTRDAFPIDWAMTQNNLAVSYRERIRGDRKDNLAEAIAFFKLALKVYTQDALPDDCRRSSLNLGNVQVSIGCWSDAISAYEIAIDASDNLYQACLMLEGRFGELRDNRDLFSRATYAYGQTDEWSQAIATIERGRARGLSDSLQRDRANLTQLQQSNPELRNRYGEITNQLRNLEAIQRTDQLMGDRNAITPEARRNEAQRLNRELTETLEQIREVPGYEKFLQPPTFDDLKPSFRADNPLIYLITTPQGSLALIALPDRIDHLWLDDFTTETLNEHLQTWLDAYNQRRDDNHRWLSTIETITGQLWQPVMEPVVKYLKDHNQQRATLIPTGLLSLLPLHAAWTEDKTTPTGKRYALDEICFTYAPNGQSLTAAREVAQNHPALDNLLAIENPTGDLPNTHREIETAVQTFADKTVLPGPQATVEAVKTALPKTAIAHFSCHGTADFNEPLKSGLLMSDGLLTLNDLFALKLTGGDRTGIRLAILSACETGLPGLELADEAIGLPTGLLQAGVAGVVASLWAVDDLSTSMLVRKFYQLWRDSQNPLEPYEALRQAQIWLRDSTDGQKKDEGMGIRPTDRDARSYAHPFYWAGFSYVGV